MSELGRPLEPLATCSAVLLGVVVGWLVEEAQQRGIEPKLEQLRREAQETKGRVQHDLVSYLFHELRNDANASVGIMDMLCESRERERFTDEQRELLEDGRTHAHHAARVITNLLDWVKLQANALRLPEEQPFELAVLAQECAQLIKHLLKRKPISLKVVVPDVALLGAPLFLKQILLNLLTNAAKYTPEGEITFSATVETPKVWTSARVRVRFAVEDTGVGVPEESRASIFDEFQSSSVKVGTGLGLGLSRALVTLMGGHLELSTPANGRGSIFAFACELRRQMPASPEAQQQQPIAEPEVPLPGGVRVLVADDIALNRKLLIHVLKRVLTEPQFIQVDSGESALKVLLCGGIDVAFIDEHFAGNGELRGTEVTQKARDNEKEAGTTEAHQVVIIGVTGNQGRAEYEVAARAAGQNAVWGKPLPKPVDMKAELRVLLRVK